MRLWLIPVLCGNKQHLASFFLSENAYLTASSLFVVASAQLCYPAPHRE
jgi:hypothetical protein